MSQVCIITKKCRKCKPFLLDFLHFFRYLFFIFQGFSPDSYSTNSHCCKSSKASLSKQRARQNILVLSCMICYFVSSGFRSPLVFFSTSCLVTITICPQPMHFRRKSAPTRRISHSWLPHGCGFFSFTISPTSYTISMSPLFAYYSFVSTHDSQNSA